MFDEEKRFYQDERSKFQTLLNSLDWSEEGLLKESKEFLQCPLDPNHRYPKESNHLERCRMIREGFSADYSRELLQYEQETQLLGQSSVTVSAIDLSQIVRRPVNIDTNVPLTIERETMLFTPSERAAIAQSIYQEAQRLSRVPPSPMSLSDILSKPCQTFDVTSAEKKPVESRDRKRRSTKYVTRNSRTSFYDTARTMIQNGMALIEADNASTKSDRIQPDFEKFKSSKRRRRSSSSDSHAKKKKGEKKETKKHKDHKKHRSHHHRHHSRKELRN